ncbi:MAG: hypothetical protein ABGW78_07265 [Pirellulales bacterium]
MPASPVGDAIAWASRIMAIGFVMFLPSVAGKWLDDRFDMSFLGATGLILGFIVGLIWLIQLSKQNHDEQKP